MKLRRMKTSGWCEIMTQCPICGHKGWCAINHEQTIVHCMRVPSEKYFDSVIGRQYTHYLDPSYVPATKVEIEVSRAVDKKPNHHLNRVYRAALKELELSDFHVDHLLSGRGMEAEAIGFREYRTLPVKDRFKVAKQVISRLSDQSDLLGVPGFFCNEGTYGPYWTMSGESGLMIPYRTITNEIVGWQIRVDKPRLNLAMDGAVQGEIVKEIEPDESGRRRAEVSTQVAGKTMIVHLAEQDKKICNSKKSEFVYSVEIKPGQRYWWWSSGSKDNGSSIGNPLPVHLALPHRYLDVWDVGTHASDVFDCSEVWVTEGPIKADLAADIMQKPFLAIPGVGAYQLALKPLIDLGAKHVVLAFDADIVEKSEVKRSLQSFATLLASETDMSLSLALWDLNLGKGIDDLLMHPNNYLPEVSVILE